MTSNTRGSIWRKWDLHVHTPETKFANGYDNSEWDAFVDAIEQSDVKVFGITDYFSVDNYYKFIELHKQKYPNSGKVFFPNIELRLEVSVNKKAEEVNLHVVIDKNVERTDIEDFLRKLQTNVRNAKKLLSCFDLSTDDDYQKASVQHGQVKTKLNEAGILKDQYLILAAANNAGLRPDTNSVRKLTITDSIDQVCNGFFGGSQNTDYYMKTDRYEDKNVESLPKPVFGGSDSHSMDDISNRLGKQSFGTKGNQVSDITWVKADCTFLGLKQVFNECNSGRKDRIFIGIEPESLEKVRLGKSRYIDQIKTANVDASKRDEWFNFDLPVNHSLVAIIGKKGSGKSALADILALGGRTHIEPDMFSFLNKERFRKQSLAKNYKGEIIWHDGNDIPEFSLNEPIDIDATNQRVKYLPQKYVEEICNELGVSKNFQKEINKVVYSYLTDEEKASVSDIETLLKQKTKVIDEEIGVINIQISNEIDSLVKLEDKTSGKYKEKLEEKLNSLKQDLKNLEEPKKVNKPRKKPDAKAQTQLKELRKQVKTLETQTKNKVSKRESENKKYKDLGVILDEVKSFYATNKLTLEDLNSRLYQLGLKGNLVSVKIASKRIVTFRDKVKKNIDELDTEINSITNSLEAVTKSLKEITSKQEKEFVLYEDYLEKKKAFELKKKNLIGKKGDKSLLTIKSVESELNYLSKGLQNDINSSKVRLIAFSKSIYDKLNEKKVVYEEVYSPLKDFVEQDQPEQEKTESIINFDVGVNLEKEKFIESFLAFIDKSKTGSFRGNQEAIDVVKNLLENNTIGNGKDGEDFINTVLHHLTEYIDKEGNISQLSIESQLNSSTSKKQLYIYLFGLSYLDTKYRILFNGKDLNTNEFSPGEKGIVLLIFYLLIDKDDIPLIIDQPEENLDNESVYELLVPYLRKAKSRRQIIMVTHNPNLAVVCDAEQVIVSEIKKKNGKTTISYKSGSIEDPFINQKIVNILEGTMPAFDVRAMKYIRKKVAK